jgi:signal transduction histidine kinase
MYRKGLNILILLLFNFVFLFAGKEIKNPVNGILDLRSYHFDDKTVINLNGQWEFYWKKLLQPDDFKKPGKPVPDLFGKIPSYWKNYKINGQNLPGKGYATYRLLILLPEGFQRTITFDVPVFDDAFRLYLNDFYAGGDGKPGISEETSIPGYAPFLTMYYARTDTLQVLIQVSNYHHRRGGFWKTMRMGATSKIVMLSNQYKLISNISLGVLISFSLFFLVFFLMYRREKVTLFFSLALVGIFFRLISTDVFPILLFADNVPWNCMIRTEYLGSFVAFGFGMWYFYFLYPGKIIKLLTWINSCILLLLSVFVTFFRVELFAWSMFYFQPAVVLFLLYYLVVSTICTVRKNIVHVIYLSALVIFIAALVNDILVANSQTAITRNYSIHFAAQLFVFIQAILIIRKWILTYKEKERLHQEINHINRNLEKMIEERTTELNKRNKELQDALDFKDKVFYIIAHDLRSPVASLTQSLELINLDLSEDERHEVFASLRNMVHNASNLIDNLLFWGRSQGKQINFNPTVCDLRAVINQIFRLFNNQARQKSISMKIKQEGNPMAYCDKELIRIVLRNLISNALKFTPKKGEVVVSIIQEKDHEDTVRLMVADTGIGIPEDKLNNLFTDKEITTAVGTEGEKGTGLGLRLCYDLVKINKGNISIESTPGKGTNVNITLPLK